MFQWSGSRRCREPPATSGRLVPAAAAVPAATAQQSDDKHDDEQCGEVHNTLLRVPADARCHSCFGCRALQPMINSRITSRFQGVLKRGSAARVQDWGFREAARGAEPCARRNPLLGRGVLTGYAVLPTASITIPTIRATPRPQDCSSLNPHAFRSSIPAIARGVKGRTWRTQSAKSPQTALQRSGARTMGCRSIPSRLATLLDGLRTAPRGSRRALASPDLRPPPARSRRRSPRRCALLGDGGSREWCEATSAASDGLAAQSHPLLPRSGRCGSSHRRLTTRLGRPARSGARRGECPSRSADTSWHRPQPLRPVN